MSEMSSGESWSSITLVAGKPPHASQSGPHGATLHANLAQAPGVRGFPCTKPALNCVNNDLRCGAQGSHPDADTCYELVPCAHELTVTRALTWGVCAGQRLGGAAVRRVRESVLALRVQVGVLHTCKCSLRQIDASGRSFEASDLGLMKTVCGVFEDEWGQS